MAVALQVVGLLVLTAGLLVCFGLGPALIAAGGSATVVGTAIELDRRRR